MNAMKKMPLLVATAALAAATIGLTAGLAPASAAPAQTPGASLVVTSDPTNGANYYRVVVKGFYPMNEYDAHGFINNLGTGEHIGGMDYAIRGDDPDANDYILGNRYFYAGAGERSTGYLTAQSDGIQYFQIISVPKSVLNEDEGLFDDTDEIYVQADFVDGDGGVRTQYTNPVSGIF